MTTIEELQGPTEYREASLNFRMIWLEYLDREKEAKDEIIFMFKILVDEGYSRTEAIQKIKDDHSDLKGFSKATIYRKLPDEMKQEYGLRELKSLNQQSEEQKVHDVPNKPLDVSFETYENINTTSDYETPEDPEESPVGTEEGTKEPLIIDLPSPEPEIQDPKIKNFVGQLPKPVLRLAEKIELSPTKLELLAKHSSRFKDHPKVLEILVKEIAPLSIKDANHAIAQKIRNLETGALVKTGKDSYTIDYDKREKIPKKVDRVKHPIEYYLELLDKIDEIMYLGTGYKITREDEISSYEPNHVDATQKHRFAILNDMDERQISLLEDRIEVLRDLLNAFNHEINEVFKNKK